MIDEEAIKRLQATVERVEAALVGDLGDPNKGALGRLKLLENQFSKAEQQTMWLFKTVIGGYIILIVAESFKLFL
jgi:hypothetical protein